jgi:hypothetical protein
MNPPPALQPPPLLAKKEPRTEASSWRASNFINFIYIISFIFPSDSQNLRGRWSINNTRTSKPA